MDERGLDRLVSTGMEGMPSGIPKSGSAISAWRAVAPFVVTTSVQRGDPGLCLVSPALQNREGVRRHRDPRSHFAIRPLHPDSGAICGSQAEMNPTQLPTSVPAAHRQFPKQGALPDGDLDP